MTYKLLFVCLGNICRSPSAENIMNHLIQQAGLEDRIVCDSAGTSGYHIGASPDSRMNTAAIKRKIELKGKSRKLTPKDLQRFDLILAMDRENYEDILYLDREGKYEDKVRMICEFTKSEEAPCFEGGVSLTSQKPDKEVPDPYYGGSDGFDRVIDLLFDACAGLLDYIVNSEKFKENTAN